MIYIFISLIIAILSLLLYFDNKSKSFGIIEELKGNLSLETTQRLNLESKYNKILDDLKKQESLKRSKELDEMQLLFTKVNMLDDKLTFLSTNIKNKMDLVLSLLENNMTKFEETIKTPMVDLVEKNQDDFEKFEEKQNSTSNNTASIVGGEVEIEAGTEIENDAKNYKIESQNRLEGANLDYSDVENFENADEKPLTIDEFCSNNFSSNNDETHDATEEIDLVEDEDDVEIEENIDETPEETILEEEIKVENENDFDNDGFDNDLENEDEEDEDEEDDGFLNDNSSSNIDNESETKPNSSDDELKNNDSNNSPFDASYLKNIIGKMDEEIGVVNDKESANIEEKIKSFDEESDSDSESDFDINVLGTDNENEENIEDDDQDFQLDSKEINDDEELDVALKKLNDINVEDQNTTRDNSISDDINNSLAKDIKIEVDNVQTDDIDQVAEVVNMYNNKEEYENNIKNKKVPEMDGNDEEIVIEENSGFNIKDSIDKLKAQLEENN